MKSRQRAAVVGIGLLAAIGIAGPGVAGQDIGWTWNSSDHDSKAKFVSNGDNFHAYEYAGSNFVDYKYWTNSTVRWNIPGSASGTLKKLNLDMAEGKAVTMKVCQNKENWPDDCSATKSGVS